MDGYAVGEVPGDEAERGEGSVSGIDAAHGQDKDAEGEDGDEKEVLRVAWDDGAGIEDVETY